MGKCPSTLFLRADTSVRPYQFRTGRQAYLSPIACRQELKNAGNTRRTFAFIHLSVTEAADEIRFRPFVCFKVR